MIYHKFIEVYMKNYSKICEYIITNSNFNVTKCMIQRVGNANLYDNITWNWTSTPEKPFLDMEEYRIWCVTKGRGTVYTKNEQFDITEGNTYFIPPNFIKATKCEDFMEQFYIHFTQSSLITNLTDVYNFNVTVKTNDFIFLLINKIYNIYTTKQLSSQLSIRGAMLLLLSFFINNDIYSSHATIATFFPILKYIDTYYTTDIKLKDMADILGYSPIYFCTIFKKLFLKSPMQFITTKRLILAQNLLSSTNLSITDIAEKCGFKDSLYFSRVFTKNILCTPSIYRKTNSPSRQ